MNRYELNMSVNGTHYCRIIIPDELNRNAVVKRAKLLSDIISFGLPNMDVKFNLTAWSEEGTPLNMD